MVFGVDFSNRFIYHVASILSVKELAGLPALQVGESGQVRKEAATANYCKCRG
jgi:hypothetical protein